MKLERQSETSVVISDMQTRRRTDAIHGPESKRREKEKETEEVSERVKEGGGVR